VTLSWTRSPAATSYTVKRSTTSGGPYLPVPAGTGIPNPSFADRGLTNYTSYYYVVSAANAFGESLNSGEIKAIPEFKATQVSASDLWSAALMEDGSVWAWGANNASQLGTPSSTTYLSTVALEVPLPPPLLAISAGFEFCLALAADGTVWGWGDDGNSELGDGGASVPVSHPVHVPGLSSVVAISAGHSHVLALKSDGTVWGWGANNDGQIGTGTTGTQVNSPTQILGLTQAVAVSAGKNHSLALLSNGTVWAWGYNADGELGNGTTGSPVTSPVQVANLTGITSISAGGAHSLAVDSNGQVWAWGSNTLGQLGTGAVTPGGGSRVQVAGISGIVTVSAGENHSLAAGSDGSLWAWGSNSFGQLGTGTPGTILSDNPVSARVSTVPPTLRVAGGTSHSLAIDSTGAVWAWGSDVSGELGNGGGATQVSAVPIPDITGVSSIQGGDGFTVALRTDHTVWSWGTNNDGQLGQGTVNLGSTTPGQVVGLTGVTALSASAAHTLAITASGGVSSWGYNGYGQLGNGTTTTSAVPVSVLGLTGVTAVSGGGDQTLAGFSLALCSDGLVRSWGYNNHGQLGNGTTTNSSTPAVIPGLTGITAMSAGDSHALAVKSDGTVWSWGYNSNGQLGNGTTTNSSSPAMVSGLSGIVAVAAGATQSLALGSDGTVWAWGGLEGPGGLTTTLTPARILAGAGISAICAGALHSAALATDGTVWTWGNNNLGQLGNESTTASSTPLHVPNVSGVIAISAGTYHTLVILSDHSCEGWGSNNSGELAITPTQSTAIPIHVTH
jgi:alpha-tubulin suppressor-like RCC1 family protein